MAHSTTAVGSFSDLYERMVGDRPFVSSLLSGHLAVEFLLRRLVRQYDPRLGDHADSLRHAELITLNHQIGTLSDDERSVLVAINKLRNKLAHQITFEPSLDELRQLWRQAAAAFSDMTDGIEQGREALAAAVSVAELEEWVFPELFVQICYDLHNQYVSRGGDQEIF